MTKNGRPEKGTAENESGDQDRDRRKVVSCCNKRAPKEFCRQLFYRLELEFLPSPEHATGGSALIDSRNRKAKLDILKKQGENMTNTNLFAVQTMMSSFTWLASEVCFGNICKLLYNLSSTL